MNKIINGVASEYDMPMKYENKSATIFIDTQDMEERYGEQLYQEYLEKENKELKEKVEQLEEENRNKNKMYERLLFNVRICIGYIKNGNLTKASKHCEEYHHHDFANILEILEREKGSYND